MKHNTKTITAVILVTLGVVVLAYSGLSLTTAEQPVYFLGMHNKSTARHFIPSAIATLALVSGIVLLLLEPKRAAQKPERPMLNINPNS